MNRRQKLNRVRLGWHRVTKFINKVIDQILKEDLK